MRRQATIPPPFLLLSPRSPDCPTTIRACEPSRSSQPRVLAAACPQVINRATSRRELASPLRARTLSFTAVGARAHAAYSLSPSSKPLFIVLCQAHVEPPLVLYQIAHARPRTHTPSPGSLGANPHTSSFPPSHDHPELAKRGLMTDYVHNRPCGAAAAAAAAAARGAATSEIK
jgi:hypothetical protein